MSLHKVFFCEINLYHLWVFVTHSRLADLHLNLHASFSRLSFQIAGTQGLVLAGGQTEPLSPKSFNLLLPTRI